MTNHIRIATSLIFAIVSTCIANAQTLTVTSGPLDPGQACTVTYSNPNKANETICVVIDNGDPISTRKHTETLVLDANGEATFVWEVADDPDLWWFANFNAPNVDTVIRDIDVS